MQLDLEGEYLWKLETFHRGPLGNSHKYTCTVVNNSITVDYNGNCFLCICDGWLPVPVGKVDDFETFESVFESEIGKHLQQDIADKKYTYCATELCGIAYNNCNSNYSIYINLDESCNLQCPSCRIEKVMHTTGTQYEKKLVQVEKILQWLNKTDKQINVVLSGNGDPLASLVCRPLLKKWPYNKHSITLHTNGLLIEKQLANQPVLNQIDRFRISIDAGSEEIYHKVRLGGNWKLLLKNLDFVASLGKDVELIFTVQNNNISDLEPFCELVKDYGFVGSVTQLDNWQTWGKDGNDDWTSQNGGNFFSHDVLDTGHANYPYAKAIINKCMLNYKNISFASAVISRLEL